MAQSLTSYRRKISTKPVIFILICIFMIISLVSFLNDNELLAKQLRAYDYKLTMLKVHSRIVELFYDRRDKTEMKECHKRMESQNDSQPRAPQKHVSIIDGARQNIIYSTSISPIEQNILRQLTPSKNTTSTEPFFDMHLFGGPLFRRNIPSNFYCLKCDNNNWIWFMVQGWSHSNLGKILFNRGEIPNPNPNANRTYVVLVWKYWNWLKKRHVFNYGTRFSENNILEGCSVNNCIFSGNDSLIDTADAVLIHLARGLIPNVKNRNLTQRWVFLNDESPNHAFSLSRKKPTLKSLYNVFNWSMTYRSDSDVPVPYGRAVPRAEPYLPDFSEKYGELLELVPNLDRKKRSKRVAVLMSNCGVKQRNKFLTELSKYVQVDVYGGCARNKSLKSVCPGHFTADCDVLSEYLFYLVLENSRCNQYLTEKLFYNAYAKGAIPVIFGVSNEDIETLLPPHSYLHADLETNITQLGHEINVLSENTELLLERHMWRIHYEILNEHGYFGTRSYHLCRLCEALNYNSEAEKIYDEESLDFFLNPSISCFDYNTNKNNNNNNNNNNNKNNKNNDTVN